MTDLILIKDGKELMEIYIYHKTSMNLTDIRKVLSSQKEFLDEAFKPANQD